MDALIDHYAAGMVAVRRERDVALEHSRVALVLVARLQRVNGLQRGIFLAARAAAEQELYLDTDAFSNVDRELETELEEINELFEVLGRARPATEPVKAPVT